MNEAKISLTFALLMLFGVKVYMVVNTEWSCDVNVQPIQQADPISVMLVHPTPPEKLIKIKLIRK